eukprot:tig00020904_g15266.t1
MLKIRVSCEGLAVPARPVDVRIVGSSPALGSWAPSAAPELAAQPDGSWIGEVAGHPAGTVEYKVVAIHAGGEVVWEQCMNRTASVAAEGATELSAALPARDLMLRPPGAPAAALARFVLVFRGATAGEETLVVGSAPELGAWDPAKGLRMRRGEDGETYSAAACIEPGEVNFKFVTVGPDGKPTWEAGSNRRIAPGPGAEEEVRAVWESVRAVFSIYYPLPEGKYLAITGDPPELGAWARFGPQRMQMGKEERTLQTGAKGRCWEIDAVLTRLKVPGYFAYRYVAMDSASGSAIWEREPNRRCEIDEARLAEGRAAGGLDIHDVNFVAGMQFHAVPSVAPGFAGFFIGPYPQCEDDVTAMKEGGVDAVLNVQTDEDHAHRMVNWGKMEELYARAGIAVRRHPIRDFDGESLRERLPEAVHTAHAWVSAGKSVYVHCTAGMGRAPAVVVLHLCWAQGLAPEAALAHVKAHRAVAAPNMGVVAALAAEGPPPGLLSQA